MEKLLDILIIPHDKALHIVYGMILFAIFNLIFSSIYLILTFVLIIAGAKEIYDSFHVNHNADPMDIAATFGGAIIGFICTL
jgi:uncharacterized membrane protein